jgi:hypothetical protein
MDQKKLTVGWTSLFQDSTTLAQETGENLRIAICRANTGAAL